MKLVVVDTNVFVGALKSDGGANRRILRFCLEGRLEPLMGDALLFEYEAVLGRRELFTSCRLDEAERNELLDAFLSVCRWSSIYYLWRPNLRDEADNHVVELAASGGVSVIISHILRDFIGEQMEFLNIRVMTPGAFLKELEEH
jgi:putative PIN family toxin of toxin-antitoxin system